MTTRHETDSEYAMRKGLTDDCDIKGQADNLRGLGYPEYDDIADTLEALNKVYEAGKAMTYADAVSGAESWFDFTKAIDAVGDSDEEVT